MKVYCHIHRMQNTLSAYSCILFQSGLTVWATARHLMVVEVITANMYVYRICRGDCRELYWRWIMLTWRSCGEINPKHLFLWSQYRIYVKRHRYWRTHLHFFLWTGDNNAWVHDKWNSFNFLYEPYGVQTAYMEKVIECLKKVCN